MPPPGNPNDPPGGAVPPGYTPPPGFPPPGGDAPPPGDGPPGGGFTPPGAPGGMTPPGATPPGGGYTPPGGGFSAPPSAYGAPGGYSAPGGFGGTPGPLAEWQQRALGGLIDYVGPSVLLFVIFLVTRSIALYFLLWLASLAWGGYNAYLNGATGQSIGKKVVGLKVLGEQTGQVIGAGMGIVRWLIPAVIGFIPCIGFIFFIVDLLFPLWDAKKQTLHDKAVKSVVIVVPK
ncbi:MAG: RDD family protein [Acidimicrobiales bacterium]|nr:RDD family protein [Acidimicrobiales bacterium]